MNETHVSIEVKANILEVKIICSSSDDANELYENISNCLLLGQSVSITIPPIQAIGNTLQ